MIRVTKEMHQCPQCGQRYPYNHMGFCPVATGEKRSMAQASYDYWMKLSDKHGGRAGLKRRMKAIDRKIEDLHRERDDLHAAHLNLLRND